MKTGVLTVADEITIPAARVIPFIRRITKGLLYTLYPDYDYFSDSFTVKKQSNLRRWEPVSRLLKSDSRGDDVFEFWHGIEADTREGGIWIYRFYGQGCFVCMHRHGDKWQQPELPGYKEFEGLPEYL